MHNDFKNISNFVDSVYFTKLLQLFLQIFCVDFTCCQRENPNYAVGRVESLGYYSRYFYNIFVSERICQYKYLYVAILHRRSLLRLLSFSTTYVVVLSFEQDNIVYLIFVLVTGGLL